VNNYLGKGHSLSTEDSLYQTEATFMAAD
jgi:hypothetical protein